MNMYRQVREELKLSREAASERAHMSPSQLERIESGKHVPTSEEVLALIQAYDAHELCNYHCNQECALGQRVVRPVKQKDLAQIVVKMLSSINRLNDDKRRLVDIAEDEIIEAHELTDFAEIEAHLDEMQDMIYSLKLWVKKNRDAIDEEKLKAARKAIRD